MSDNSSGIVLAKDEVYVLYVPSLGEIITWLHGTIYIQTSNRWHLDKYMR